MRRLADKTVFFGAALLGLLSATRPVWATDQEEQVLEGQEWKALGLVTGFHSVRHKQSGLEARLLESDGSASVAQDPVALYLVVTNNGSSDLIARAWRVPRGVARVRGLLARGCGVDVQVEIDRVTSDGQVQGVTPKTLRLCFLSPDGKLQPTLQVSETSR